MAELWNYADVWEEVADLRPGDLALAHGSRTLDWAGFDREADGVAGWLLELDLDPHAVVALCLRNRPEYLTATFACFKVGAVPANTNFRYTEDEISALWTQADVRAVVYDDACAAAVEPLIDRLDRIRGWLRVPAGGSGAGDPRVPTWPEVATRGEPGRRRQARAGRSGEDPYVLFTGGTTGRPKGVLWRQDDLFVLLNRTAKNPWDTAAGLAGIRARLGRREDVAPRLLVAAPLMHGLGALTAISALTSAGSVVTLTQPSFSPIEFLDRLEESEASQATIVGDAMATPVLEQVEAAPGRWSLGSLRVLLSSGTAWTAASRQAFADRFPAVRCVDVLGATEAIGVASAVTIRGSAAAATGRFVLGPDAAVVDAEHRPVVPGSGVPGQVVVRGRVPVGYLGDPAASAARCFETAAGRWTLVGDWATVRADGSIQLLGRGSSMINTGGEKVFPDEVEDALRACPSITDAAVVGIPHPRLGQQVVALVETVADAPLEDAELRRALRRELAGFKIPRRIHRVDSIGRGPNGKLDRPVLEARAAALPDDTARPDDTAPPGDADPTDDAAPTGAAGHARTNQEAESHVHRS